MRWFRNYPACLALFACAGLLPVTPPAALASDVPPRLSADSLHSLLEQALAAFSHNDFAAAAELFQRIERDFSVEPEYQDPQLQRRMLPLKGHAELAAGQPAAAAVTLARFVDAFPDDARHPPALYAFAIALRQSGATRAAVERFGQFETTYPRRPEAGLALLQRTEILFDLGQAEEALALLHTFSTGDAPAILRDQARIRAARLALDRGDANTAARLLLDYRWNVETMPEVAVLSFTALTVADLLMEAENIPDAIRAYRLVLPRPRLLELQNERIAEIREKLQQPRRESERFWTDYYRGLLDNMIRQATALRDNDDYTTALLLRRGQAFLLANRPHEAWLLFEQLALDETLPLATREDAHYRWTVAANSLQLWEEGLTIARNFLARYPDAPLAAQTLYLIAQAHQEQRRFAEATEILADLQARFPDHPLAQRWRFSQGFNRTLMEKFDHARDDFRRAAEDFPDGALTPNAELWHALTFFFERDYATALSRFDALADRYATHPLTGEILYRRVATLYAIREYERAEKEAAAFVDRFHHHQRHGETLVLLGDILMGAGKLDEALEVFEQIPPDAGAMFLYGLFQQGKILRAQQDYEKMIALFSNYAERTDPDEKPRLSEALYWIGWAHTQADQPEKAVPLFLATLENHGDDPAAAEIGSILALLEKMHPLPGATYESFSSWIEAERQQALPTGRLTWFSRLNLHLASIKRRQNLPHQADSLLFEIAHQAPIEALGPEALGQIGHFLLIKEMDTAGSYFDQLLKKYPHAPEKAFAYHGCGRREVARANHEEALIWFRRFEQETPSHPLAGEVLHLAAECLLHLDQHDEAAAKFEEILRLRSLRGRPHAAALMGLAKTMLAAGQPERAVAYYQRVYTVHRAQSDLVAEAYFASSGLFEALDDLPAAHRTLTEMLSLTDLADSKYSPMARDHEKRLAARIAAGITPLSE